MVAKHVNKKNDDKPRVLVINALLHSLPALAAAFSTVALLRLPLMIQSHAKVNFARI